MEEPLSTGVIDGGTSPAPDAVSPQADSPVGAENVSAASPEAPATESAGEPGAPAEPEFVIPENDDDLQGQEHQPHVKSLIQQRQQIRTLNAQLNDLKPLESFKPLTDIGEPDYIKSRLETYDKMFSPAVDPETNQPLRDDRGLVQRTSRPFFDTMETEQPGFAARHFGDLLDYEVLDPVTQQKDTLSRYFFRAIGLDPDRVTDYQNIDTLLAKSSGAVDANELQNIAEPDREAYKTLPSSIRSRWADMADDEQRYHIDGAREKLEARQYRERQETERKQAEQQYTQQFESRVTQSVAQDLSEVRTSALTTLRENLAKSLTFSGDGTANDDYMDAIIAPLALLIDPELAPLGQGMLERMGVKLDADFNETISSFVTERENFKRAEAYQDQLSAKEALRRSNGLQAKLMSKFNSIALKRAERFGHRAKAIATSNGNALTAASAVRVQIPGNDQAASGNGLLPAGMDPRSEAAVMYQWHQSTGA